MRDSTISVRRPSKTHNPSTWRSVMFRLTTSAAIFLAVALFLLSGCGREDPPAATSHGNASGEVAALDNNQPALREASLDPSVKTVSVDRLIRNQKDYAGLLAIQGVVVQCFEERGAFVMVDVEEFKSCGLEACTDAAMSVRITRDLYEGSLPRPGHMVTVIGAFEPLDRGFRFDLREVHRDGSVILERRQSQ